MSDTLTGQRPKDTYGRLLQIANANEGADSTLRAVMDGKGEATPLYLSTLAAGIGLAFANYITFAGGGAGSPVTITAGGEASPDIRFVLPSRGLVNIPRMSVGDFGAGASSASPRLFSGYADQTLSGAGGKVFRWGGIMRGSSISTSQNYYEWAVDEDRVGLSSTDTGNNIFFLSSTLRAGWSGGRTLGFDQLYVGNPAIPGISSAGTAGPSAYHVARASFAYSYTDAGGVPGAERGNLFGANIATRVRAGSGPHWNSTFGIEADVGVEADTLVNWKGGIKVVQWSTDSQRGLIEDYAYGLNLQSSGTAPGWMTGFALGGVEGWWPFTASSSIMKMIPGIAGGLSPVAAAGIDLRGITFGSAAFASDGYRVDGSGNLGALTASGVALQTRSAVNAATAVVGSVTVREGGLFIGAVTLTFSAPTTSGTTATATVATYSMPAIAAISVGGTDYAVGDIIQISGGTSTTVCEGVVTKIGSGGSVAGIRITTPGSYSVLPASPAATATGGSGSGCTATPYVSVLTINAGGTGGTLAGTNYSQHLPPTLASSGATSTQRQVTVTVSMTATAAPVVLASNYGNYASFTGATATGVFDTGAPIWQAAGSDTHIDLKALGKGTNGRLNTTKLYVGPSANRTSAADDTITYLRSGMTYSTAAVPGFHVSGGFSGTVTTGQAFYHHIAINSDTVDPTTGSGPQGTSGLYLGHSVTAGAKGGRTALFVDLNVLGAITASASGEGRYQTAVGGWSRASASAGGASGAGNLRGNLFGGNFLAKLTSGAGIYWNGVIGTEINVATESGTETYYKNGLQVVQLATDAVDGGGAMDAALMVANQHTGTAPGWDYILAVGHGLGWWPLKSGGTIIGTVAATTGGGPAYAAANGVDFSAVAFSGNAFASSNFSVDGNGDMTVGDISADNAISIGGNQVMTSRRTGWGAPTGTPTRTTFATGSVTLSELAERVKALIDDLTTHGAIGA